MLQFLIDLYQISDFYAMDYSEQNCQILLKNSHNWLRYRVLQLTGKKSKFPVLRYINNNNEVMSVIKITIRVQNGLLVDGYRRVVEASTASQPHQ